MNSERRDPTDWDVIENFKQRLAEPKIFGLALFIFGIILSILSFIPDNAALVIAGLSGAIGIIVAIFGVISDALRGDQL
jgi:hypothetical protein